MRLIAVVVGLAMSTGCSSNPEDEPVTKERACEMLRDHLVDLRVTPGEGFDVAAHREALQRALGEDFVGSCARSMSDEQVLCAARALDNAGVSGCVTATK